MTKMTTTAQFKVSEKALDFFRECGANRWKQFAGCPIKIYPNEHKRPTGSFGGFRLVIEGHPTPDEKVIEYRDFVFHVPAELLEGVKILRVDYNETSGRIFVERILGEVK